MDTARAHDRLASALPQASLSAGQRQLLSVVRSAHFGAISNLVIRGGEPVFDPPPVAIVEIKFGDDYEAVPRRSGGLHPEDAQLLEELRRIGNGVIDRIEIRHGLPFRLIRTLREGEP